ncbi:unnamed protein product [Amoebophrya sp. A120]|nr:unnamed protein product [Amoebophrya sp. A120]|eukprot:GSA120T00007882001.1
MRVGIVGYGSLGQFLCEKVLEEGTAASEIDIVWVWNRTASKVVGLPQTVKVLQDLEADYFSLLENGNKGGDEEAAKAVAVDLIVEVAHPDLSNQYAVRFLQFADYYMGSPTAMANAELYEKLQTAAKSEAVKGSLYLPVGALWCASDLQRMAELGTLKRLCVTMKKHPKSLKLTPGTELAEKLENIIAQGDTTSSSAPACSSSGVGADEKSTTASPTSTDPEVATANGVVEPASSSIKLKPGEHVIFHGSVRELCPLAPNNVNTMACAAIAGSNLGFDKTEARLVADYNLTTEHVIDIRVDGPDGFFVECTRVNPAKVGAVTGQQTYLSFLHSLRKCCVAIQGKQNGVFFC